MVTRPPHVFLVPRLQRSRLKIIPFVNLLIYYYSGLLQLFFLNWTIPRIEPEAARRAAPSTPQRM